MSEGQLVPNAENEYSPAYFAGQTGGSVTSAERIVPIVMNLLGPSSVVDVGCGTGPWARSFRDHGVPRVLGVDGDYVDRSTLLIDEDSFLSRDLTQPLELNQRFDLAVALEVACDLPPERAEGFVADLVELAPAVLFSSAIPLQGGQSHVNERWQSYWVGLFDEHGYVAIDAIRPAVWNDERVMWWYAQNAFLYVRRDRLDERLEAARVERSSAYLDVVSPRYYLYLRLRTALARPRALTSASRLRAAAGRRAIELYRRVLIQSGRNSG